MIKNSDVHEIIFLCDDMGIIQEIMYPSEDVSMYFSVDQSFTYHVHPKSFAKALSFMMVLSTHGTASNHEVSFDTGDQVKRLFLSGVFKDNQFMIVASKREAVIDSETEEMMRINNEQMNVFRKLLREAHLKQKETAATATNQYDEITKLNNELINIQRELARKNAQLEHLNAQLEMLATRDTLTGLYNRRLLSEKYEAERRRSKRLGYKISVAMVDLNNFKQVNDQLGHLAGDDLLVKFAEILNGCTRQSLDLAFRMGGDEFLLLLTDCDMDAASTILERLGEAFTKHTDIASLAYGIIEIGPDDDVNLDEVVRLSDDRMFADKKRRKETER
jgi:diguanylate cyclase (GGDEF)-like protein